MLTPDGCSMKEAQSCSLFAWKSWRLKRVAIGTSSAEAQALCCMLMVAFRAQMMFSYQCGVKLPIDLRCDHDGIVKHVNTSKQTIEDVRVAV